MRAAVADQAQLAGLAPKQDEILAQEPHRLDRILVQQRSRADRLPVAAEELTHRGSRAYLCESVALFLCKHGAPPFGESITIRWLVLHYRALRRLDPGGW